MNFKTLRLLLAEKCDGTAAEFLAALKDAGYELEVERVQSLEGFCEALRMKKFDLILGWHPNPDLDVLAALAALKGSGLETPLMVVCEIVDGPLAVELIRRGAIDIRFKDDLAGFVEAVEHLLRDAVIHRKTVLASNACEDRSEILEMILSRLPVTEVLNEVVKRVEALTPGEVMVCVMLANAEETMLRFGAGPSLPVEFRKCLELVPILERGGFVETPVVLEWADLFSDVSRDPVWAAVRPLAESAGIRSCWSVGIFSEDHKLLGTLSVYLRSENVVTVEEIEWMEASTRLLRLAIERAHSAELLRQSEVLFQIASESGLIGGWMVDLRESRITWSDKVRAIHEVGADFEPSMETALDFCAPEFVQRVHEAFEQSRRSGLSFHEEMQIITATGKRVWVRMIGEAVRDDEGEVIRIQGALQDISFQKQVELAEETRLSNERRYLSQRNALISLNGDISSNEPSLIETFRRITEVSACTLEVARASIWRFTADRLLMVCLDQYDLESGEHSSGATLVAEECGSYFEFLSGKEIIAVDDARQDPLTRDLVARYLIPNGVTSMMDLPIRFGRSVSYIICNDHTGPVRQWTSDEKTFAVAIANHVSLALERHERALAQAEVLHSHQRFQSVAAATNDTIWDWNLETDAFWWYDGYGNLFGRPAADSETSVHVWIRQIHPDDRERVVKGIYAAIGRGETHWVDEYRFVNFEGRVAHVRDRGGILHGPTGRAIRMVGGMTDLTEGKVAEEALERSHRTLRMLSSCNEMLVRASTESGLLAEACRLAVEVGGYRMAWVGYAGGDPERRVVPMAHAGHEDGYLTNVDITWADDKVSGQGPTGRAIRAGTAVVIPEISEDLTLPSWSQTAIDRGYRSIICLPLFNKVRPFGVLCLYGGEVRHVGPDEMKMLGEMANELAFGIENIRSRVERRRAQDVVVKVAQAVSSGVGSEFFELLTRNMVEAMDAHGGLIGRFDPATNSIDTLSFFQDGRQMGNVTYSLEGTPCANVAGGQVCVFESGVQQNFPDDHLLVHYGIESYAGIPLLHRDGSVAGIMALFFSHPLGERALVTSTLQIFATRVASELDRQQAEARIREQASLLDKARDAIIVRDLNQHITFWNKGAERLYGWKAEEVLGRSFQEILYLDLAEFGRAHAQTLTHGEWVGELRQVDRDGRELTIEGRWTLVRDEQGRPESVFALNTDISEHRKLEQQFLRAQRLESIGTLAGGIAHDLNNILAPISMSIELLRMRVQDTRSQELLATIASSARRGSEMIGQVLSFARGVEGRHLDIHPLPVIREIENILRDTILRGIELETVADRELWMIRGDPTQIHQVILNLCVNARDAVTEGGKISIIASNVEIGPSFAALNLEAGDGPHVCIEVSDTGVGIPEEIMDRIFDPFFTTKSTGKGTGLGLSTSLAIIRSHGGFIRVTSNLGEGSRFSVYLPATSEMDAPPAADNCSELPAGTGETILVVDDEAAICEVTRRTLEAFGYNVMCAGTGDEAVRLYRDIPLEIDVVLTDMMMPGMDGAATIARLREINPAVRVIATSGIRATRQLVTSTLTSPAVFLDKPHTSAALLECLHRLLNRPDLND